MFFYLKRGISIDHIDFGGVTLDGLYLKLDQKLSISASRLNIASNSKSKIDLSVLDGLGEKLYFLDLLFSKVELNSINIGQDRYRFFYLERRFLLDTPYASLDAELRHNGQSLDIFVLNSLKLKNFDLSLSGLASLKNKGHFAFSGSFSSYELQGKLEAGLISSELFYRIYDTSANSIKNFMDAIESLSGLSKDVRSWIEGDIVAKHYELKELKGRIDLDSKDFFLNELEGQAIARDVSVRFDQSLPAAFSELVRVSLKDGVLDFTLEKPSYEGNSIDGSKLFIHGIFADSGAGLVLDILSHSMLNQNIKNILKAYDISLPISQQDGKLASSLRLDMIFEPFSIKASGEFELKNSNINLAGVQMGLESANIKLNENELEIKANGIDMGFLKTDANASIDLERKIASISSTNLNINLEKLISIKNAQTPISLDFSTPTLKLNAFELGLDMSVGDRSSITLSDDKILKYSPIAQALNIKNFKNIAIFTDDFTNFNAQVDELGFDLALLLDENEYSKSSFSINASANKASGASSDGLIKFEVNNGLTQVWLKGLGVDINRAFSFENSSKDKHSKLNLKAKNCFIKGLDRRIDFNELSLLKNGDFTHITAQLVGGGKAIMQLSQNGWALKASELKDTSMNQVAGRKGFKDGSFSIAAGGKSLDDFRGEWSASKTRLTDLKTYQGLLSFLDSIPTLLSLQTPDFNQKGFTIKNGKIRFNKKSDTIRVEAIELLGSSADIGGHGEIFLDKKELDLNIELRFLKATNNIINQIPLLNQVILGRDRSISTIIKISGSLDSPSYKSEVLKDTLLTPLKIIRNILQLPADIVAPK